MDLGQTFSPIHKFASRSMAWTRTGGAFYPRSPGHQRRTPDRPATGTSVASGIPPVHSGTPTRRPPEVRSAAWGHGGGVLSRACLRSLPLHRASCWPLETRRGAGGWGFELTGWPMWGNPGGTDVPAAGRGDVRCRLRGDCSWSGERGSPVLLHFILLEKNLRGGFDLVDRIGYTSSEGIYLVEQTDLVEQPGCIDRTG